MNDVLPILIDKCVSHKNIKVIKLSFNDIVFKERNKILCFYCGNYGHKWTCPPKCPTVDYKEIFKEYDNYLFIQTTIDSTIDNARAKSTMIIHKLLLELERILYDNNIPTRLSFIGGSCKLCKGGCAVDKCRRPYEARIPLEATGVDIMETCKGTELEIKFPVNEILTRTGMIMW